MRTNEIVHINGRYKKMDCDLIDKSHVCIHLKTGKDIRVLKLYIMIHIFEMKVQMV